MPPPLGSDVLCNVNYKISNFNMWTAKHLVLASCTELTVRISELFSMSRINKEFTQILEKVIKPFGIYEFLIFYDQVSRAWTFFYLSWQEKTWNGILIPKLFWPNVRRNCCSDHEKFWNSRLKAENLQKFWDH